MTYKRDSSFRSFREILFCHRESSQVGRKVCQGKDKSPEVSFHRITLSYSSILKYLNFCPIQQEAKQDQEKISAEQKWKNYWPAMFCFFYTSSQNSNLLYNEVDSLKSNQSEPPLSLSTTTTLTASHLNNLVITPLKILRRKIVNNAFNRTSCSSFNYWW